MSLTEKPRHRLLERQLKKAFRAGAEGQPDLDLLLELVSQAYEEQEETQRHNNEAIDLVSREVTDLNSRLRREAEARSRDAARLNALLDNASEAIISVDIDAVILSFNRSAERMFGYTAAEAIGKHAGFLHDNWKAACKAVAGELDQKPGSSVVVESVEMTAKRSSGEIFPAEFSLSELEFEGEKIGIAFYRDISSRKAAESALVSARDEAEGSNRAKSEFLAAMSHEIRTPLNGVLGMAAAMEATPLSDEQRRMLGVINESGQILMTLLSDILDLSKIEAGRMVFESTPFDPSASAQAVARLYGETAQSKGLDYRVEVAESARNWFVGDPTRYRQVLQNLVSNALKFTSEGAVVVAVEAEPQAGGRARIRTSVTDTGCGVSDEARRRLFRKFSQADASTTRRYGGTGLGLSISKQLVEAMGGEIALESEPGQGSKFWFDLFLELGEAPEESRAQEEGPARPASDTIRILAAEDNPTNQLVLKAILAQWDVEVVFANNGIEAIEAVRQRDFDLVLMDVQMPVMDGITATQTIRSLPGVRRDLPIVAVTADAMPEQVKMCLAAGMTAHVSKPLKPENLFSVISEALDRNGARSAAAAAA